jgi:hypothetical protein
MGNNSLCHDLEAGKGAATSLLIAVHATAGYNIIRSCDVGVFHIRCPQTYCTFTLDKFSILSLHPRPIQGHLVDVGVLLISPRMDITPGIKKHLFFGQPTIHLDHPYVSRAASRCHTVAFCENVMRPVPRSSHTLVS